MEILGPNGWEAIATAFLRNGRYLAASADHYSIGSYEDDGQTLKAEVRIIQHGNVRTVFGSKKKYMDIQIEGEFQTADQIVGTSRSSGDEKIELAVRMTRLGELD